MYHKLPAPQQEGSNRRAIRMVPQSTSSKNCQCMLKVSIDRDDMIARIWVVELAN